MKIVKFVGTWKEKWSVKEVDGSLVDAGWYHHVGDVVAGRSNVDEHLTAIVRQLVVEQTNKLTLGNVQLDRWTWQT